MSASKTSKSGSVLIVGGGIGGMQAALDLADSGFKVHMVQRDTSVGGTMVMLDKTFPTGDCAMCMISPKMVEVGRHLNIDIHTLSEVTSVAGQAGDFTVKVKKAARYVDPAKCTGCGDCEAKCPKKVPSEFDLLRSEVPQEGAERVRPAAGPAQGDLLALSPGRAEHPGHRRLRLPLPDGPAEEALQALRKGLQGERHQLQ
ncbi:MAG: FAD-dependent oxidoreductase [Nitrospirota bacterium]